MNMAFKVIVLPLLLLFTACGGDKPDSAAARQYERVISLSPHVTEIIYALHGEQCLVARTDFCTYPPRAAEKPSIGGLLNPNLEQILSLQPDLLIGSPAHTDLMEKLSGRNMKFVLLPDRRLEDIIAAIDSVGHLLHRQAQADSLIRNIQKALGQTVRQPGERDESNRPRAVFLFGGDGRNVSVIGPGSFTDDLWTQAGGANSFAELKNSFAQINREALLQHDPDLIIQFRPDQPAGVHQPTDLSGWQSYPGLKAVHAGQIYCVDGPYALIPGPRIVKLMEAYRQILEQYFTDVNSNHGQKSGE